MRERIAHPEGDRGGGAGLAPRLRLDGLRRTWALVAPARAARPRAGAAGACPFCPGHENETPPELAAVRPQGAAPDGPGWLLRVVPNRYPAVGPRAEGRARQVGPQAEHPVRGRHEVIVPTPRHVRTLGALAPEEIERLFEAVAARIEAAREDRGLRAAIPFANVGPEAGASIEHVHAQLVALPFVPPARRAELRAARRAARRARGCVRCAILRHELAEGARVVAEDGETVTLAAFAPRAPFEVHVLPRAHEPDLARMDRERRAALARATLRAVRAFERLHPRAGYNVLLVTAPLVPVRDASARRMHVQIEIVPRLATPAGFELLSGMALHGTLPEAAAGELRAALAGDPGAELPGSPAPPAEGGSAPARGGGERR